MSGFLDTLTRELANLLKPVTRAVESDDAMGALLGELGVLSLDNDDTALLTALSAVVALKTQIEAMSEEPEPTFASVAALLDAVVTAFEAIAAADPASPLKTIEGLGRDLVDLLIAAWLHSNWRVARQIGVLLTLIDPADEQPFDNVQMNGGTVVRGPFQLDRVHIERLGALLRDPKAVLQAAYVNALATDDDAAAMADKLFPRLVGLLRLLHVNCRYGVNPVDLPLLGDAGPLISRATIVYFDDAMLGAETESGVVLSLSPASRGDLGLVIAPFGEIKVTRQVGNWAITSDLSADVDVLAWGRHGLTWPDNMDALQVAGSVTSVLAPPAGDPDMPPTAGPVYVIGDKAGTRLEIGGAKLSVETALSVSAQSLAIAADLSPGALVITAGNGDGFLASLLPADGLRTTFDFGFSWSSTGGLSLHGGAGLQATFPVGLSFAGVTLSSIHIGIDAQDTGVDAEVSASLRASIGPVTAVLDRIGVLATIAPAPTRTGSFGSTDFKLGFKGPSGVGVTVDAGGILTGGGFLFRDEAKQLYAGALQLTLQDQLTVKAFGLIDGSRGYSLLIFITADGFEPVELGFGFMLTAIGGMIGINRTFDQDVIRAGLKNDTLKSLLFPRDPITNAPAVIQALSSSFPAKQGSYLLGLLARLTWFTPTLATFDLALILEFGARTRLLALGRVSILLPTSDNDLIRVNLDSMGVLDFDAGTVALDATLVDSRLLQKFTITGSAALRAGWGSGPASSFLLSVGGFNPHFVPPAGIPALDRVSISLSSGNNPKLHLDAYFAVTSNSVEFGAHASLYAEAGGFSISGDLGFDVLITHPPLKYIADFQATVQLKYESHNLFKLDVKGSLAGSKPTRLSGKASFSILWCDFSVPFDHTFDSGSGADQLPSVSGSSLLVAAFSDSTNWTVQRVPGVAHGVALRTTPAGAAVLLDPLGQLKATQLVVPLNTARAIDTINGAPVAGDRRFHVTATVNGEASTTPVQAPFAPAHFFEMSDDDKLVAPSFQLMDSGLLFGSSSTLFDHSLIVPAPLEYDAIVLNPFPKPTTKGGPVLGGPGNGGIVPPILTAVASATVAPTAPATPPATVQTPVTKPPVTQIPLTQTPVTQVPVTQPPIVAPPVIGPILDPPTKPPIVVPPPPPKDPPLELRTTYTMPAESLGGQVTTGAAARVAVRRVGRRRFGNTQAVPAAMTAAPRWAIVPLVGGDPAPVGPDVKTWTDYKDALATLNRAGAVWQLLPAHEAES